MIFFTPTHVYNPDNQLPGTHRYLRRLGVVVLHRGLEAIDRGSFLLPGVPGCSYMVGLQQGTTERFRNNLQDPYDHREPSYHCIARLPEPMAARAYSGRQPVVALPGVNCSLSH